MSRAIRFLAGAFGRTALLEMDAPLVAHAHHHSHVLVKTGGADAVFEVRGIACALTDDDAVLVNAWEPHAYLHHARTGATTEILALYIEPAWLADAGLPRAAATGRLFARPAVALSPRAARLAAELTALLRETRDGEQPLEALLAELMIAVIEPFLPECRPWRFFHQAERAPPDARIRRAMAIMHENAGAGIDMAAIAARCGLSRAHFFELFRRTTSLTPAIYANELRMEAAFDRLARTPDPVAAVAGRLGFSAPGHFTRFFRSHIGITPRAYRRALGEVQPRGGARLAAAAQ